MTREEVTERMDQIANGGFDPDEPRYGRPDWARARSLIETLYADTSSFEAIDAADELHELIDALEYRELNNELEPF